MDLSDVDKLVEKVKLVIESLSFEERWRLLGSFLEKVIIKNQTEALVKGDIPLDNQVRKVGLYVESRQSWDTILPFEFRLRIPPPR